MPNLTIYVPRDLADELRHRDIPVSRTCQVALRRKVRLHQRGFRAVKQEDGTVVGYVEGPSESGGELA